MSAKQGTSEVGSIATEMDASHHVRFTPGSDRTADIAGGPVRADSVAKVPKRHATKFPLNDKTSGNRRSM